MKVVVINVMINARWWPAAAWIMTLGGPVHASDHAGFHGLTMMEHQGEL